MRATSGKLTIGRVLIAGAALAALLGAASAEAQTYRCVGKDGKKYYGQVLPQQCAGQPSEMLDSQGMVIRRIAAAPAKKSAAETAQDRQAKAAADHAALEEKRRNAALLDTYANVKEIELARSRALQEINRAKSEIEKRIDEAKKRQAKAKKEMEFYKGGSNPPQALEEAVISAAQDVRSQKDLLAAKMKEADEINAKYDNDKRRFIELTGRQ